MIKQVPLLINGEFITSKSTALIDVTNPATQEVIAQVPCATDEEIKQAIEGAKQAFEIWKEKSVGDRARLMLNYQALLKSHQEEIATILSLESGKTFPDAMGDVWRGIEVVEHAANVASLTMGETLENVARKIDCYSFTQPLGVCVGVTPFNFPAMIPLWMFPIAIACGNAFILKPSEQKPNDTNTSGRAIYRSRCSSGNFTSITRWQRGRTRVVSTPRYAGDFFCRLCGCR